MHTKVPAVALQSFLLLGFQATAADARGVSYDLDIPAQVLNDALQTLAIASQHQLLYSSELVDGKSAPAVKGTYTTEQAVRQLLIGTNLTYEITDGLVLIRSKDQPLPPAGASSSPRSREAAALRQDEGKGTWGSFRVAQAENDSQGSKSAGSEGDAASPGKDTHDRLEEIVVTGTRRQDRTVAESSAPIDVLNGSDLASHPSGSMLDTLSSMVPSFEVGQNSISDASSFVRAPSLRGLPADQMLVMLNGKRLNRSAVVQVWAGGETELAFGSQGPDLASIPSIAIKSLEILRDGASAQYGSDAIAGVLNYQFRNNSSGLQLDARYGSYFPSGYSRDGDDTQIGANLGLPLGSQGFVNISAEFAKNEQTIRNPTRPSALAFAATYPNLASRLPHYPGPVQEWGTPPTESFKTVINSGINLSNGDQVYLFANYADIDSNFSGNYRLSQTVTDANGNTYSHHPAFSDIYLDPCTSAFTGCPADGFINNSNTFNFSSVYPAGFTPRVYGATKEFFGAVGYKGTTRWGMNYDLSGTTAENSLAVSLRHSMNPSLGPVSPTDFYAGKFVQREQNFNFDTSYLWKVSGLASPVSIAAGLERREETYRQLLGDGPSIAAGPYASQPLYTCVVGACTRSLDAMGQPMTATQSTASNAYGGISTAVDATQTSYAGYLDIEADITQVLTLGVAGRVEHYSSFGTTTLGKLQARFEATDWLALRATASTGFHAPSPGQSNVETLSTTFTPGTTNQVQIGTYQVTSPAARYYGAVPLKPENSTNLSAGVVLTPIPDMLVTLDWYSITVRNRIGISQAFNVTAADIANLPALAYVGDGGTVQYFTNGFGTETKGVDLVTTYPFRLGNAGRLDTTLLYSYNRSDVTDFDPTVITPARIIDIQHYAPNHRGSLSLAHSVDKLRIGVHQNYYGTFRDEFDYPGQLFSAKWTTDLDVSYQLTNNVTATLGGRNIFNTVPDTIADGVNPLTDSLNDGQRFPRQGGPFGYNGAFWYVRLSATF